tara:strand:+ start:30 stop:269 length:240 start_codon:yes stop_codon:yes gene_type:complete
MEGLLLHFPPGGAMLALAMFPAALLFIASKMIGISFRGVVSRVFRPDLLQDGEKVYWFIFVTTTLLVTVGLIKIALYEL